MAIDHDHGWCSVPLSQFVERLTRRNLELDSNVLTISATRGLVSQRDYFGKQIASENLASYYRLLRGEFAYNKSYSAGYPLGAIKRLDAYDSGVVSPLYICFSLTREDVALSDYFVQYVEAGRLDENLRAIAAEGARNHGLLNVKPAEFLSLPVTLPPLPEQKKIAAILSSVDETIAKTEAVIAQLQIVKKAMMEQLLTKGMPGRHTRFQTLDTEWRLGRIVPDIGEIPETWRLVHITDVARLESGHTPSRNHPEYWEGDIPWVSLHDSKNLDGPVIMDTAQTIGALGLANSSARMLPKGTVVFSRTATVGKCTVLGRDMSTSQDFANYVCGPTLDPRYLMHLMRNMQTEWKRLMAGSTHQTIYMPVFRDLQILLPPMDEQRQIAAIGDQFHGTIASEYKAVAELKHLKSALSSSLLSGEIRVIPEVAE